MAGNKFVNGAIFGGFEALSVLFSGVIMRAFKDMTVFYIIFTTGMVSYATFLLFPSNAYLSYIANCFLVGSLGGWQNIYFLIAEYRVPPKFLGSTNMIAITVGISTSTFAPTVASLPPPTPL